MILPNVRKKRDINGELNECWEGHLSEGNSARLGAYDHAVEAMVSLFDNLDMYKDDFDFVGCSVNLALFLDDEPRVKAALKESFADWAETKRTEYVLSLLSEQKLNEDPF